ncbi:MAG: 2-hydroxyacyl-CoA dehydratase [candidate division WOR-3 bacterium]
MRVAFPYMGDIRLVLEPILHELGAEVIIPPEPNRETVALGAQLAPETICLPFKVTLGNIIRALELGADTLVYVSGSWSCRFGYYGRVQADIVRDLGYKFQMLELRRDRMDEIARQIVKLSEGRFSRAVVRTVRALRLGWFKADTLERAYALARAKMPNALDPKECQNLLKNVLQEVDEVKSVGELRRLRRSLKERFASVKRNGKGSCLRIKLVGESYCVIEPLVNFDVINRLGEMGVWVDPFITGPRWLGFHGFRLRKKEVIQAQKVAQNYWRYCVGGEDANSVGHLILAAQAGYDGVLHIHPFACMPSTVVQPVLFKASRDYDIPLLSISIDEHTGETGFITRVEAFVSLLERRRRRPKDLNGGDKCIWSG